MNWNKLKFWKKKQKNKKNKKKSNLIRWRYDEDGVTKIPVED